MPAPRRIAALLLIACLAAPATAQTVYSWKDARGVTHYADAPPPKGAKVRGVKATVANPPTPRATASTAAADAPPAAAQAPAATDAQCAQARLNLSILEGGQADIGLDADRDGKPDAPLDAAGRARQLELARDGITRFCPPGG